MVKNPPANAGDAGDLGSVLGSGRSPGKGKWQPTPEFLPRKFHGQRSPVGYSPWGCKESDTTDQLSIHKNYLGYEKVISGMESWKSWECRQQ